MKLLYPLVLTAAALLTAPLARAHHSFAAEFDRSKPVKLTGVVTKLEWQNPHIWFYLDVKNDDGTMTEWSVQAGAPSFLYRNGWRKDSVKPGDELIITGYSAKDGSHNAFAQQVRLPDGRRVLGGAIIGARLLAALRRLGQIETHLIISPAGAVTAAQEMGLNRQDLEQMADVVHNIRDIGAAVASGSFQSMGMVIAPCSMKTLASVAHGLSDNLLTRAADVILKERRRLVLVARETPLNLAHLRNMTLATEMGAIVMPPMPAFYAHPKTIEDVVDHLVGRILDLFDIRHNEIAQRWAGLTDEFARQNNSDGVQTE